MKTSVNQREVAVAQATNSYRRADKEHWKTALWCSKVVGKYDNGATLGMARDMSVSTSTIENHAHAYFMFQDLCSIDRQNARLYVFQARRLPYIYYSHFRALYDARNDYKLTNEQCFNLLIDIVQAEGEFSARDIDQHVKSRFGDTKDWTFYAQKAQKHLDELLRQPDLPKEGKTKIVDAYNWIGDNS